MEQTGALWLKMKAVDSRNVWYDFMSIIGCCGVVSWNMALQGFTGSIDAKINRPVQPVVPMYRIGKFPPTYIGNVCSWKPLRYCFVFGLFGSRRCYFVSGLL